MKSPALRWIVAAAILLITAFLAFQVLTLQVGMARYRSGDMDGALPWLRSAMVLNPFTPSVRDAVAITLLKQNRIDEAERVVRVNLERRPNDAQCHNIMGMIHERRGKQNLAMDEYQTAVRIEPDYAEALFNMGYLFFKMGRYDDARLALDKAVKIMPELGSGRDDIFRMFPQPPLPVPFTPSSGQVP